MTEPMLLIPCVERCGLNVVAKLPLTAIELERVLDPKGWIISVMSPPGTAIAVGILCPACAKKVHSPEVLAEMKRIRDARLS